MTSILSEPMGVRRRGKYTRRISTQLALALVVSTLLQIVIVSSIAHNWILHLGIVVVIAMVIPAARNVERRWEALEDGGLPVRGLETRFRMDCLRIWGVAILLALAWIPLGIIF